MSELPKPQPETPPAVIVESTDITSILLTCSTGFQDADALCLALKSALLERVPNVHIGQGNQDPVKGELAIRLQITRADDHHLEGHLAWETSAGENQQGPDISLGVSDTVLAPHMFGTFVSGLVKSSGLPLP